MSQKIGLGHWGCLPLLVVFAFASGCTAASKKSNDDAETEFSADVENVVVQEILAADKKLEIQEAKEEPPVKAEAEPAKIEAETKKVEVSTAPKIPLDVNANVRKWIHYFSVKEKARFQRFLDRGAPYRKEIESVLRDHGVPEEMYYLAMIESGFSTHARSHASAVGVWQFIRGTAKRYGLHVGWNVDERRDPMRATRAAARYLKDLHNVFQSWYLAMAGYNAGERRVMRAILKGKTRNFWKISSKRLLPRETRNYVPKFLAAMIIGHNPEKFGFKVKDETPMRDLAPVRVPGPIRLTDVARLTQASAVELKKYNPHLLKGHTPRSKKTYEIWVPVEKAGSVEEAKVHLSRHRLKKVSRSYASRSGGDGKFHRIRRGETLQTIARRYGTSIRRLKRMNDMRSSVIYAGQLIRVGDQAKVQAAGYRVRRGDNLQAIARKFGTSVGRIKRLNGMNHTRIYAGQYLKLAGSASSAKARVVGYRVRRGDSLAAIARRFGTSIKRIKNLNRMRSNRIYAGQFLKVASNI